MRRFESVARLYRRHPMIVSVILAGVFYWVGAAALAAERNSGPPAQTLDELAAQLSAGQISRMEVYYFNWTADTAYAMTEEDLLRQADYRVTIYALQSEDDLIHAIKTFKPTRYGDSAQDLRGPERLPREPRDLRLGCLFFSKEGGEVFRFFFVRSSPVISIYGTPYRATGGLLDAIAQFIPGKAYDEMRRTIFSLWMKNG